MLYLEPIEYVGRAPRRTKKSKRASGFGGWLLLVMVVGIAFYFVRPLVPVLEAQRSQPSKANAERAIEVLRASGDFSKKLAAAALERTKEKVEYDPGYYDLSYPGGDVPAHKGICADLVVRSYRSLGVDLQKLVHEDMSAHFRLYPQIWERRGPDANIDHRRVPNLQRFFSRFGKALGTSESLADYEIGDVVTWRLPYEGESQGGSHIGIVVPGPGVRSNEKWVVHNVGSGPEWEDMLFGYEVIGHYRFKPHAELVTATAETETDATLTTAPSTAPVPVSAP